MYPGTHAAATSDKPAVIAADTGAVLSYRELADRQALVIISGGVNIYPREVEDCPAAELITYAREHIAHYKVPRTVSCVDELPRTPTGKLVKHKLANPTGVSSL